jgi:hypothetical protein
MIPAEHGLAWNSNRYAAAATIFSWKALPHSLTLTPGRVALRRPPRSLSGNSGNSGAVSFPAAGRIIHGGEGFTENLKNISIENEN